MANESWSPEKELDSKILQSVVLKEMMLELAENGSIPSSADFMYKHKRSYAQIQKIKKYLIGKEIIEIQKIGKFDKMVLTTKGKAVVNALVDFIKKTQKVNGKK